jgi:hypothetical protein
VRLSEKESLAVMGAWLLKAFSGEQPRISPNLLPANAAQAAIDTRLDGGDLAPLRAPSDEHSFADYPGGFQSIYRHGADWLGWTTLVHAAPGPVASDRLYITGDGVPKMRVVGTLYDLKVPFPATKLTASMSGAADEGSDVISRVYVYTYVTDFGEESEPSPASDVIEWQPGLSVNLTGFVAPPAGRNITKQRIYRTQTGPSGTDLYFIAERDASADDYDDEVDQDGFGEVIPSRVYNAPPDNLVGLTAMPNGMMAAFVGRDLYFCEPWQPHAWPEAYVLTTDYEIVALGAIGTALVVLTKGNPYLVQGTHPSTMQMVKTESNLPCINARGVVDLGFAIAYPSHEGLCFALATGEVEIATAQLFNRESWQQFNPGTLAAGQLSGSYVASFKSSTPDGDAFNGTLMIDTIGGATFLRRSAIVSDAMFYDISAGALYFLTSAGVIRRFDSPGGAPLNQLWRSKPLLLSRPCNFSVMRVDASDAADEAEAANINAAREAVITKNEAMLTSSLGAELGGSLIGELTLAGDGLLPLPNTAHEISINVYADDKLVGTIRRTGKPQRLPSGFEARKWEVEVFGTARVQQIAVAESVTELRAMAAG